MTTLMGPWFTVSTWRVLRSMNCNDSQKQEKCATESKPDRWAAVRVRFLAPRQADVTAPEKSLNEACGGSMWTNLVTVVVDQPTNDIHLLDVKL